MKEKRQEIICSGENTRWTPNFLKKARIGISQRMEAVTGLEKKREHEEFVEQEAVKNSELCLETGKC